MRTRQLSDLRADAYKASDLENATALVPAADVNEYLNQGWTKVYRIICRTGLNYYLINPPVAFTAVSGQDTYYLTTNGTAPPGTAVLPTDMFLVRGLDAQIQQGRWQNLFAYEFEQRNDFQASDWSWPRQPLYDYIGAGPNAAIRFIPPPSANTPMRLHYYPAAVRLVNDTDVWDGVNGWELYAVWYAAREMALKDENYELVQPLERKMAEIVQDIQVDASRRNAGMAPKMRRVRYKKNWPWPGGAGRF